jgi:histidinol dehydrogenase
MLKIFSRKDTTAVDQLFARRVRRLGRAQAIVSPILEDVRKKGDRALVSYARQFDGLKGRSVRIPPSRLLEAQESLPKPFLSALNVASRQIRLFSERQMPKSWNRRFGDGVVLGQEVRPLNSVAAYIPGGRYPLPSTLMMTVIPAQTAGVRIISAASPTPSSETLGTAGYMGVNNFFHMGGAQAIAAFAFGTETVPRADRIVGPGNIYVAAAKKLLAGTVGIDFVAGPTEIFLIAADGNPRYIAADILAQAEHDTDAAAVLLTTSKRLARRVQREVARQLETLPTGKVASKAIVRNSAIILTGSLDEAVEISNRFAPEHLVLYDENLLDKIENAGSIFLGPWSPEAAGDYASGPNHVLPTGGVAKLRGGLSVLDYIKVISVQRLQPEGLRRLAPAIVTLARAEGLEAHARSVEIRLDD